MDYSVGRWKLCKAKEMISESDIADYGLLVWTFPEERSFSTVDFWAYTIGRRKISWSGS